MASNPKPTEVTKEVPKAVPVESVYSASELADNHKIFGVNRDIVVIALRKAGKNFATITEAKTIIDKFKNKEVK